MDTISYLIFVLIFQKATQIRSTPFTEESDESSDDDAVTTNDENESGTDAIVPTSPTRSRSRDVRRKQQLNQSSSGAIKRGIIIVQIIIMAQLFKASLA